MLTNKERNFLRRIGNELSPIVIVGKGGINDNVVEQLDQALTARELVKCRVLPHTDNDPRKVADTLAKRTSADVVLVVGNNMLLYRRPEAGKASKLNWPAED